MKSYPSAGSPEFWVACGGRTVNWKCTQAIRDLTAVQKNYWRFVMSEWLTDTELTGCSAFMLADPKAPLDEAKRAMRVGLPILVPEENAAARKLCVKAKCGLYFSSHLEAEAMLIHLAHDPLLCKKLGANALRASGD
jgi:hypothetical protein